MSSSMSNTDSNQVLHQDILHFIKELYPNKDFVALHEPVFGELDKKFVADCIDSTFVSSVGKYVNEFEDRISKFTKIPYAIAAVNGTAALHIALLLCDVRQNDEVLTQALTFVATANAISYCKAEAVFIDSDLSRLGMCADDLENFLIQFAEMKADGFCYNKQTGRRLKACVPMHVFGHPVDIIRIQKMCKEHNISLIEDSAESLGSSVEGSHTGLFGDIAVLSFNGNKTITTGGGGMIVTKNEALAIRAKHLTTTAKIPHRWEFFHDEVGYNYRLPNLNAALGCAQMEKLTAILENKRKTAQLYKDFFSKKSIQFMDEPTQCKSNFWLNAIMFDSKVKRDDFLNSSSLAGIQCRPVWALMTELKHFSHCQKTNLKNATFIRDRLVNIPSSFRGVFS